MNAKKILLAMFTCVACFIMTGCAKCSGPKEEDLGHHGWQQDDAGFYHLASPSPRTQRKVRIRFSGHATKSMGCEGTTDKGPWGPLGLFVDVQGTNEKPFIYEFENQMPAGSKLTFACELQQQDGSVEYVSHTDPQAEVTLEAFVDDKPAEVLIVPNGAGGTNAFIDL